MENKECKDNNFLKGDKLYGDDFSNEQISRWFQEEEEAYANLGTKKTEEYVYQYTTMNWYYGLRYIDKNRVFENALGYGSAYGHEFLPIIEQIKCLSIIEPSEQLRSIRLGNIGPVYLKPNVLGNLEFADNSCDLIVSFGVLHHIPNVSYVMSELIRVLKPDGLLLIREPIVSMGDWRIMREGLTKNERGIPLDLFDNIIHDNHLKIIKRSFCDTAVVYKLMTSVFGLKFNSMLVQIIDSVVSRALSFNYKYHRTNVFRKIAPSSIFYVLKKTI